ncbi:MAG: nuclear transport factor 2 family protein [Ilumatobacteraceae bacterium]
MRDVEELADRLVAAIESGDVASVASIYADDAVIWHNTDQVEQSKVDNLAVLGWLVKHTASRHYREIRRSITDTGFVQQHVLHIEFADGRSADLPACLVVQVSGDRITRLDEYLDNAGVIAAFGRAG